MSAMEVDAGVEEKKGQDPAVPSTAAASAAAAVSAERIQKGKGEGQRVIMLHPVRGFLGLFFPVLLCIAVVSLGRLLFL